MDFPTRVASRGPLLVSFPSAVTGCLPAGAIHDDDGGPEPRCRPGARQPRPAGVDPARGMLAFIAALHVVGWLTLLGLVAPQSYAAGGGVFGIGLGVTAYTLGMRHAFDADHIAAIDNTTRKLMADRQRPLSVGFWFSLGHSTIVFGLCFLLAVGVRTLAGQVEDGNSGLQRTTGVIGTLVSGLFLTLIAVINLVILVGIVRVFRRMRHGEYDEAELEDRLDSRGIMNRLLGRVTRAVTRPWQMYPIGVLFGLGFDTATEVSLLVLAGGAAA